MIKHRLQSLYSRPDLDQHREDRYREQAQVSEENERQSSGSVAEHDETRQAWASHVAEQEILVTVRFSYWGLSGWKNTASRNRDALMNPERLLLRLSLFQTLALPSLAAQTDLNFHLHVLTARALPAWARDALEEACAEALPPDRFSIDRQRWGVAAVHLRDFLCDRYGAAQRTLQVVLDDDDGLANDFLHAVRREMALTPPPVAPGDLRFVSHARGYSLDLTGHADGEVGLYHLGYPFINLGLAMSSMADGANLYGIAHRKVPPLHPHRLRRGERMFVRTIHSGNDSRARITAAQPAVKDWRQSEPIAARFPWLPLI